MEGGCGCVVAQQLVFCVSTPFKLARQSARRGPAIHFTLVRLTSDLESASNHWVCRVQASPAMWNSLTLV